MPSVIPGTARYIACLVSAEIGASPSSPLAEPEPDDPGLRYLYQLTDIDDLGLNLSAACSLLAAARQIQLRPPDMAQTTKWTAAERLRDSSPQHAGLRTPNALVLAKGRTIRRSADSSGFRPASSRGFSDVAMGHVVVLGTGEACAAVGRAALELGAGRLTVADTGPGQPGALDAPLSGRSWPGPTRITGLDDVEEVVATHADGLIHASAVGTDSRGTSPPACMPRPDTWVADVIYRPLESRLLQQTGTRGRRPDSGTAAFSVVGAVRLVTGNLPDPWPVLRYLATLTGTSAGNAQSRTRGWPGRSKEAHAPAS